MINLTEVDSSYIKSIGYVEETRTLYIEFSSGSIFRYPKVPKNLYDRLMSVKSKGNYFNKNIRNAYKGIRMNKDSYEVKR